MTTTPAEVSPTMADTSELLPRINEVCAALDDAMARYGFTTESEVYALCSASERDAFKFARALKSRLQAEAPEDAEVDEEHPLVEHVARAIAVNGVGRPWDDFAAVNAHDMDQGDLKQYALAAIRATPRTSQAEAQAPTTAASVLTEDERHIVQFVRNVVNGPCPSVIADYQARHLLRIIDRLTSTVGAPAPAHTKFVAVELKPLKWQHLPVHPGISGSGGDSRT